MLLLFPFILQLGSLLSINGVHKYRRRFDGDAKIRLDAEQGTCVAHILEENLETLNLPKDLNAEKEFHSQTTTGVWIKIFQIVFQVNPSLLISLAWTFDSIYLFSFIRFGICNLKRAFWDVQLLCVCVFI